MAVLGRPLDVKKYLNLNLNHGALQSELRTQHGERKAVGTPLIQLAFTKS
jgi:hypothetical protein